ncbi:hypothetical protein RND71_037801 [Anisodus tanguticus]|uniref:Uncharacterized protein n=1 Tax=Anisodus tanguticus TaxID=243964 RepID=A0AAE1QYH7_9SOLA|nr:hypothetical protein RND71_037801 [Anisodus tanguticus]
MASACVNKEKFLDCSPIAKYKSYGWLSPRMSFSAVDTSNKPPEDFEFPLEDPVINMFPADELFSNGKLIPLHLSSMTRPVITTTQRNNEISDPYLFSPKVPRCTTRWRELLGLKKQQHQKVDIQRTSSLPSTNTTHKSLKHFLHRRSSKSLSSSIDNNNSSLNLPLLTKDSDIESVSISSRLSLSSSYSDLPRLSLDSDKPNSSPRIANIPRRVRLLKHRVSSSSSSSSSEATTRTSRSCVTESNVTTVRGASVDSPRMNSSGKIVFHSLGRSSSSPSTFNGGLRYKHRGMERSYSANVRVTPVLNVPLCKSGVGFLLFSSSSSSSSSNATGIKGQYHRFENRTTDINLKDPIPEENKLIPSEFEHTLERDDDVLTVVVGDGF